MIARTNTGAEYPAQLWTNDMFIKEKLILVRTKITDLETQLLRLQNIIFWLVVFSFLILGLGNQCPSNFLDNIKQACSPRHSLNLLTSLVHQHPSYANSSSSYQVVASNLFSSGNYFSSYEEEKRVKCYIILNSHAYLGRRVCQDLRVKCHIIPLCSPAYLACTDPTNKPYRILAIARRQSRLT